MSDPAKPAPLTLPKSGLVLRRLNTRCEMYGPINLMPVLCQVKALVAGTGFQACFASHWRDGTRDECIAWLDEQAMKFRSALLPQGAIVVADTEATVETIERAICSNLDAETYMEQARAVLAALREAPRG